MASTVTWGNLMALVLPGTVFMLGTASLQPQLAKLIAHPNTLSAPSAAFLLMLAALIGGLADGLRRVTTEKALPIPNDNVYAYLTSQNLPVFKAGVENSYRYYTFYGNLAVIMFTLAVVRVAAMGLGLLPGGGFLELGLLLGSVLLECASRVEYGYFTRFCDGFVESERHRRGSREEKAKC